MMENNRSTEDVKLHSIERARFLFPNAYKFLVALPLGEDLSTITDKEMIKTNFRRFGTPA